LTVPQLGIFLVTILSILQFINVTSHQHDILSKWKVVSP
jgi:hypothetical protein